MAELCPICEGAGLRVVERPGGIRVAEPCACRVERRSARMIEQAKIPKRYQDCTLDDFVPNYAGENKSLSGALLMAKDFVKSYPLRSDGKGLLLVGGLGVGKTHLAIGMLQALIKNLGVKGLFCDYRDLLKKIQDSYGRSDLSERQILAPVFDAEVLVLDELGAAKPTDWVWDTVQHILNTRYNDRRTTIITTNYPNEIETANDLYADLPATKRDAKRAMREDTLGDRITERMRSRLQEMCVVVEMKGQDFRQSKPGRATFENRKFKAEELFALETGKRKPLNSSDSLDAAPVIIPSIPSQENMASGIKLQTKRLIQRDQTKEKSLALGLVSSLIPTEEPWTQEMIDRAGMAAAQKNRQQS
jgi:DNA replication protein DnaC